MIPFVCQGQHFRLIRLRPSTEGSPHQPLHKTRRVDEPSFWEEPPAENIWSERCLDQSLHLCSLQKLGSEAISLKGLDFSLKLLHLFLMQCQSDGARLPIVTGNGFFLHHLAQEITVL